MNTLMLMAVLHRPVSAPTLASRRHSCRRVRTREEGEDAGEEDEGGGTARGLALAEGAAVGGTRGPLEASHSHSHSHTHTGLAGTEWCGRDPVSGPLLLCMEADMIHSAD
jgi:hypothetical protein